MLARANFSVHRNKANSREIFEKSFWLFAMTFSGALTMLAARPKWMERPLSGTDKMYYLHKWLRSHCR